MRYDSRYSLYLMNKAANTGQPYFMGKEVSLIDLNIAPWAMRFWCFDHFKDGGMGIPKGGPDEAVWQRFERWLDAVKARSSIKNTTSDLEHYLVSQHYGATIPPIQLESESKYCSIKGYRSF